MLAERSEVSLLLSRNLVAGKGDALSVTETAEAVRGVRKKGGG